MKQTDICFYMSITKEENSSFVATPTSLGPEGSESVAGSAGGAAGGSGGSGGSGGGGSLGSAPLSNAGTCGPTGGEPPTAPSSAAHRIKETGPTITSTPASTT